jgi:hypothetical protein
MHTERGAIHPVCGYALWVVQENGISAFFTVDWQAILSGRCPRCNRRLIRSRLQMLDRPTVRGTEARR